MRVATLKGLTPRYRTIAFAAVFLSGAVALVFQVVWQRYLAFLVGSEARSISLVVAVFLLGLAAGYRFWGNATGRSVSRRDLIKLTGYIELTIGAYAAVFPIAFNLVRSRLAVFSDWLLFDLAVTALLLFLPTFLMGASIPLLTAALPDTYKEVNYCHSRIYGINTVGAFVGAIAGGLILVPALGLRGALFLGVLLNLLVAVVFISNRLPGRPQQAEEVPIVPNRFGTGGILAFVFVTGAVSIAFEVLMMRVVSLAVGSGQYVFPVVVGMVILGLGAGSLSLRREGLHGTRVVVEILTTALLLMVVAMSVPYWAYWLSHVRVSLTSIPSNYSVFVVSVAVFVGFFLVPVYILFGRMLPVGYSLISKDHTNYGRVCGRVYFFNTLGTVVGSVVLGHLLLEYLDLESLVRVNIAVLLALAAFLGVRERGLRWVLGGVLPAGAVLVLMPNWHLDRTVPDLFRNATVKPYHFQGWFNAPGLGEGTTLVFSRDDANLSVKVLEQVSAVLDREGSPIRSLSIAVNHKTDGNTLYDYSNMVLSGAIPYLYGPDRTDLRALVVGLGTGMTSGVLGAAAEIEQVVTVEISPSVIRAAPFFDQHTFHLSRNPRSTLVQADAFRYLARAGEKFDIVVSEPSNPWIAGIENLFTPEYYALVRQRLSDDGVFFQWVQAYESAPLVLAGVIRNFVEHFPNARLFTISGGDVGLVGSFRPLAAPALGRRFQETNVQKALGPIGVTDPRFLEVLAHLDSAALWSVALALPRQRHDMEFPWLGTLADRARFVGSEISFLGPLPGFVVRAPGVDFSRVQALEWALGEFSNDRNAFCNPYVEAHSANLLCRWMGVLERNVRHLQPLPDGIQQAIGRVAAWSELRSRGLAPPASAVLRRMDAFLRDQAADGTSDELRDGVGILLAELAAEGQWEWAEQVIGEFWSRGVLSETVASQLSHELAERRKLTNAVMEQLRK